MLESQKMLKDMSEKISHNQMDNLSFIALKLRDIAKIMELEVKIIYLKEGLTPEKAEEAELIPEKTEEHK